jgi:hypothetical protein
MEFGPEASNITGLKLNSKNLNMKRKIYVDYILQKLKKAK